MTECAVCFLPTGGAGTTHVRRFRALPTVTISSVELAAPPESEVFLVHQACYPELQRTWQCADLADDIIRLVSGGDDPEETPKLRRRLTLMIRDYRSRWGIE